MDQNSVPSPGQVLTERFLEPNGITQYRLAQAIGKPQTTVGRIVGGEVGISPEMAKLLGKALGTGAEYWMQVDAAYKLSQAEDGAVEVLLDGTRSEHESIVESGGYSFTTRTFSDAVVGRAVKAAYAGATEINDGRGDLLDSLQQYLMYGMVSVPGTERYVEYEDDIPLAAIGMFEQFLIAVGEEPSEVGKLIHEERMRMFSEVGKTDIDGFEYDYARRHVRKVDLSIVGALMCAASRMEQDSRDEVMGCLFSYAHDCEITLPNNNDALRAFLEFLERCERRARVIEVMDMDAKEYFEFKRGL